jgi:hypothetical protein
VRRNDRLVADLGMTPVPIFDVQALSQISGDAPVDERLAAGVESGLVAQRRHQDRQTLFERIVAELIQTRSFDGRVLDLVKGGHTQFIHCPPATSIVCPQR